jgi:D-alanine-D-alanine ligase-like ATP-grasp enzyme
MRTLRCLLVLYESEAACLARLATHGLTGEPAREIACYLAQATDLPAFYERIGAAFAPNGIGVDFYEIGEAAEYLPALLADPEGSILWNLTDGFRYYRASYATSAAALLGVKRFGSPPQAQHLCQDKFKCIALAQSLGVTTPQTALTRNGELLSPVFDLPSGDALFVKPNTLGAKVGIFADSRCDSWDAALALSGRIFRRYGDDAVVKRYIPGYDVRVSFMDAGERTEEARLGIFRLAGVEAGEMGGAFMTMQDNWTLSASRSDEEKEVASPFEQPIEFRPRMEDLRADSAAVAQVAVIEQAVGQIQTLLGLRDYFSFDFRVGEDSSVYFLELEVCPAFTIYDFQAYLENNYGVDLPAALARSVQRAFRRDDPFF